MPRLLAVIALLSGAYRLSKRQIQALLSDLLGIGIGLGSISTVEQSVSQALAKPVAEARQFVRAQAVVHSDEPGLHGRNASGRYRTKPPGSKRYSGPGYG